MRVLIFPAALFLLSLFLDHSATERGIAAGGSEGNALIVVLWNLFGDAKWMLPILWAILVLGLSFFIVRFSRLAALWILYTVFAAHMIGFSTWTGYSVLPDILQVLMHERPWTALAVLFVIVVAIGALFAAAHRALHKRIGGE